MQQGYIKLYRCILDSSWSRQPDFVAVWVYCLLRASYKDVDVVTKGGMIVNLKAGQFITSREQISLNTGVQESKVERILKVFKSEQQIEQEGRGKFRVISILNWQKYQAREQQDEQQTNNKRTTDEQHLNTDKKVEEGKEEKKVIHSSSSDAETANDEMPKMTKKEFHDLYFKTFGRQMPGMLNHDMETAISRYPRDKLFDAFRLTAEYGGGNWSYTNAVLKGEVPKGGKGQKKQGFKGLSDDDKRAFFSADGKADGNL